MDLFNDGGRTQARIAGYIIGQLSSSMAGLGDSQEMKRLFDPRFWVVNSVSQDARSSGPVTRTVFECNNGHSTATVIEFRNWEDPDAAILPQVTVTLCRAGDSFGARTANFGGFPSIGGVMPSFKEEAKKAALEAKERDAADWSIKQKLKDIQIQEDIGKALVSRSKPKKEYVAASKSDPSWGSF